MKHMIITANLGHDDALEAVKKGVSERICKQR
jgi:hypothetical protein